MAALGEARFVGGAVRNALSGRGGDRYRHRGAHAAGRAMQRLEAAAIKAVPTGFDHGTVTAIMNGQIVRSDQPAARCRNRWPPCRGRLHDDWDEDAAPARFHHECALCHHGWRDFRLSWRRGRPDRRPGSLCRRPRRAHPGRLFAYPAPVPLSRLVRQRRDGCGRAARRRCRARRDWRNCPAERIAKELSRLLESQIRCPRFA